MSDDVTIADFFKVITEGKEKHISNLSKELLQDVTESLTEHNDIKEALSTAPEKVVVAEQVQPTSPTSVLDTYRGLDEYLKKTGDVPPQEDELQQLKQRLVTLEKNLDAVSKINKVAGVHPVTPGGGTGYEEVVSLFKQNLYWSMI